MLEHGGRLRRAAKRYDIPLADWLDLSTGINPFAYPLPVFPADDWTRLPMPIWNRRRNRPPAGPMVRRRRRRCVWPPDRRR